MYTRFTISALATAAALVAAGPAAAIKYGELDGSRHPHVALMVAKNAAGAPMWRCSGTFMSPTLYLTAGHCTYGAASIEIWLDGDVESGIPGNGYPFSGNVSGTPYTHPDYPTAAFFVNDVGVVVLNAPVSLPTYGVLPQPGSLNALATGRGLQKTYFTAVGYGLQWINPVFVESERVRMMATPRLLQINTPGFTGDFSMLLSNNHSTGGTCFGDSGGPNFLGDSNVVAGVTSFGINGNCAGTGGVFRLDTANVQTWLANYGLAPN